MQIEPGTYVVAVSGGVDSMALLHMLAAQPELKLIVAHLDHGIRHDSGLDRQLVQATATSYQLPFVYNEVKLGYGASEAAARKARYDFLRQVGTASNARAIITAHHQDDALETALLNIARGTGWRGLSSLRSHTGLRRPLLAMPKTELVEYAKRHDLVWREDSTNQDIRYLRNYIRHRVVPRLSASDKKKFLDIIHRAREVHEQLEHELINHLHLHPAVNQLNKHWFIMLPHVVAREVLATWLRKHQVRGISSKLLERLIVAAKTGAVNTRVDIDKNHVLFIGRGILALQSSER